MDSLPTDEACKTSTTPYRQADDEDDVVARENRKSACLSIRTSLSPIIIWLKIFGLYHENCICKPIHEKSGPSPEGQLEQWAQGKEMCQNGIDYRSPSSKSLSFKRISKVFPTIFSSCWCKVGDSQRGFNRLHRLYCILVSLLLVANFVKSLWLLVGDSGFGTSYRVVMVIWYSHTTSGALILLYSCIRHCHFRLFYKQWVQLFSDPKIMSLGFTPTSCRKWVMVFTVGSVASCFLNVVLVAVFVLLEEIPMSTYQKILICRPFPVAWWSLLMALILHVLNSAAWTLISGFTVCLAFVMATHFSRLKNLTKASVECTGGYIPARLPTIRMCHLRMCKLLDTLNHYFRLSLAFSLSSSMGAMTFILYQIVAVKSDQWLVLGNVWWFSMNLIIIASSSISLSMLHEAAHSPLEFLFSIDPVQTDSAQNVQLQLFLHKLTGTSIGATVLDLFVVTKEVLLTILGAFLTYFFLVMQFGI